jgi:non-reducing end alpha-L-arabinofuranosidase
MHARSFNPVVCLVVLGSAALFACSSSSPDDNGGGGAGGVAAGGASASGGSSATSGGASATGGSVTTTGGISGGGLTATGGSPAGGATATGGVSFVTGGTTGIATGGTTAVGGAAPTGGTTSVGGATATGGTTAEGGRTMGGGRTGRGGGSATGGETAAGGSLPTGGATATGGGATTGGTTGTGGGTSIPGSDGPCDIYAAASTPCVAAYSMTRPLLSTYSGPLYQVRKGGSWNKSSGMSGGTFQDIGIKDGYADSATQDTFCSGGTCTVSKLYDQSGKANDLTVAPKGCYTGTASEPDSEGSATKKSFNLNGHKVYALYMNAHDGMRNNSCAGIPTKNTDQSVYVLADGTHAGDACCWDFGNMWPDNCNSHTMNPIFFGTGYWGSGAGNGPWFMGDFEGGVWAGGNGGSNTNNPNNPSMKVEFAFGILKTSSGKYAIKAGNAQSGDLATAYDGASPKQWDNGGAVALGIGGDNSNSSFGTFYEGVLTTGLPSNETDTAVFKNVQAAGYGK